MDRTAIRFRSDTIVMIGVGAGLIFAVFEMLAAAAVEGTESAAVPLRMFAAMVIGREALDLSYPLASAGLTGMALHLVLSIVFTAAFAAVVVAVANRAWGVSLTGASNLALAGVAFSTALWIVNFYVIAPAVGWTWFAERTDPLIQLFAHAVCFGWPVGWMLGRSWTAEQHRIQSS